MLSPCGKVCSSGWTGRACRDARVSLSPVSVLWRCWPPPTVCRPATSWRSHTRPSLSAGTRHCSALQEERVTQSGLFNLHRYSSTGDPNSKHLIWVFLKWKALMSIWVKLWNFVFFLSNLFAVSFNLPSPFLHSLPQAKGRHKVLQRCKKPSQPGPETAWLFIWSFDTPSERGGRWEQAGGWAHKQSVPAFVWVLVCSWVAAVNSVWVLPAMYAVNIISKHKDQPSSTLDCLCPALSTTLWNHYPHWQSTHSRQWREERERGSGGEGWSRWATCGELAVCVENMSVGRGSEPVDEMQLTAGWNTNEGSGQKCPWEATVGVA